MADQTLQQAGAQALLNVPALLKRGIDPSKLKVVDSSDQQGKAGYHVNAIAGFDKNDPNTIHVFDKAKFLADPQPVLAHELTHHLLNSAGPGFMQTLQPIDPKNPYQYDQNTVGSQPLNKQSEEQIAQKIGDYQAAMSSKDPAYTPQVKMQLQQQIQPLYDQLAKVPTQPVMQTNQPGAADQINTNPNAPTTVFEALPPTPPAPVGSQGSQGDVVRPEDLDSEVVRPEDLDKPSSYMSDVNHSSGQVLLGAGKGLLNSVIDSNPAGFALNHMDTHSSMLEGAKQAIQPNNPAQHVGSKAEVASELVAGGAEGLEGLVSKIKNFGSSQLSDKLATEALHSNIGNTLQKVAEEAGVKVQPADSVRDTVRNVGAAVRQKGQEYMDQISHVFSGLTGNTGDVEQEGMIGNYDKIGQDIQKTQKDLANAIGPQNMQKRASLTEKLTQLQANQKLADDMLDKAGLGGARAEADRLFKQADDLDTVSKSVNKHTTGLPAKLQKAGVTGTPERVNAQKLGPELEQHYQNGVLQNAVGEDHAHNLVNDVNTGARMQQKAQRNTDIAKTVAKKAATYAGADVIYEGGKVMFGK
jgi:hypothetical protein